jgi:hypothetical protein
MKKILIGFMFIAVMGFMVGNAIAAPVEVVQLKELNVSPGQGVNFFGGGNWQTGVYNFQIQNGTFAGIYGGFCVDPANSNTNYSAYDINTISHTGNYDVAAWLLNNYYTVAGTSAVATQAAIWEVMFETNTGITYSLKTGNFGTTDSINTLADTYLALALAGAESMDLSGFYLAQSPNGGPYFNNYAQDYIFKTPEPMTLILFGLGLVGLAGLRRKE